MKKSLVLTFVMFLVVVNHGQNQTIDYGNFNQSAGIRVYAGYNTFDLSEAKEFIRKEIDYYNDLNINVQEQTMYPANSLFGFGAYFLPTRELELNMNAEFTNTKAYSYYGDEFGELDIKSEINFFSFSLGMKKYFMEVDPIQPFVSLNIGLVNAKYELKEKVEFFQVPELNREGSLEYSKLGYKAELNVGMSYNLSIVVIDLEGGYRYSIIPAPESEDIIAGQFGENPFELNNSGFVFRICFRTGIYW